MVTATLVLLQQWFDEQGGDTKKPKLLSKLALMELCGWLELKLDDCILRVARKCCCTEEWTKKNVIKSNYGFDYEKHFRAMLLKPLGEHLLLVVENRHEESNPGDLERLKSILGTLAAKRNEYAHSDMASEIVRQQTLNAPSWTRYQHGILEELLDQYMTTVLRVVSDIPIR